MEGTKLFQWLKHLFIVALLSLITLEGYAQSIVPVKIKPETQTASYNGRIKGRDYIDYSIEGKKNLAVSVKLKRLRGEYPYFNVLKKGSEVAIADDAREVTHWSGKFPSTDTYIFRVYMAKAARLAGRTAQFRINFTQEKPSDIH